jgi:hypothetical protein
MGFTLTGHSNQHRSFSTNYLQFIYSLCATCIFLTGHKRPTSYEDVFRHAVSEAAKFGVNVFPTIVYVDFVTAIHNALATVWPGLEVKSCRLHLGESWWRKIQYFGSQQAVWKERL